MTRQINILGQLIDSIRMWEAIGFVRQALKKEGPSHIVTANPEILDEASRNERLAKIIRDADLVTADGVGVLLSARILGESLPERVTGVELAEELFRQGAKEGWRFYFLGAAPGVAEEARQRMMVAYPGLNVIGCQDGYYPREKERRLVEAIAEAKTDILLVGLGSPRQDYFIETYKDALGASVLMGVGGSFDVFSGKVQRAPELFRALKLEWLYRIATDPKRWKRSLALPRFVLKVIGQRVLGLLKK